MQAGRWAIGTMAAALAIAPLGATIVWANAPIAAQSALHRIR